MHDWGASTYGEPCRQCGYSWTIDADDAAAMVADLVDTYGSLLEGATGGERHPALDWSVSAYVCHVADNLRIWAERLAGVAAGADRHVGGYDESLLGRARHYEFIPLPAALWSLTAAVEDWCEVVGRSRRAGPVLIHPERGELTLAEVVVSNAHDAFHHGWDIARTLDGTAS